MRYITFGQYLVVVGVLVWGSDQGNAQPIGSARCGKCHDDVMQAWRVGPHAQAKQVLSREQSRSVHCRSCHDDEGLALELQRLITLVPLSFKRVAGVGCESCHGFGRDILDDQGRHIPAHMATGRDLMKELRRSCARCHDLNPITLFTVDQLWPRHTPYQHGQRYLSPDKVKMKHSSPPP